MARLFVQVKLTKADAQALLELIEDELEHGEQDASDRPALIRTEKSLNRALDSLDARMERMERLKEEM